MARKRTLSTLDTSIAYEAVGLDLAKEDTAIAAFGPDHEGPYLIDRMPYDKLYELLADMAPTLVAMEPCSGGVSGFLCLGRLFQGQPNEAALCI